jgi:hypothetical protein
MSGRNRRLTGPGLVVLCLYVAVLLVSPVVHHDLACHLKTPAHCDACQANPLASRVEAGIVLAPPAHPHATHEVAREGREADGAPLSTDPSRAPPA